MSRVKDDSSELGEFSQTIGAVFFARSQLLKAIMKFDLRLILFVYDQKSYKFDFPIILMLK